MLKKFLHLLFLSVMLIAVGCSQAVAPTENNLGIPSGAKEGEYGFYINGRQFDGGSLTSDNGNASIQPYVIAGPNAVILYLSLYYNFSNGPGGSVDLNVPFVVPKPQSFQFSDASSLWNLNAIGSASYDSNGYIYYRSIPGGNLTITKFDTVNNLVSGIFEFTAYETNPTTNLHQTIGISNGYFNDIPIDEGSYGQGSISALLNGTPFISDTAGIEMIYTDSQFNSINLFDYGGQYFESFISIQRIPLRIGTYAIDSSTARNDSTPVIFFRNWLNSEQYASTESVGSTGQLTITSCDIVHRRISGTFQFSGADSLGNTINISSGVINNVQWSP